MICYYISSYSTCYATGPISFDRGMCQWHGVVCFAPVMGCTGYWGKQLTGERDIDQGDKQGQI